MFSNFEGFSNVFFLSLPVKHKPGAAQVGALAQGSERRKCHKYSSDNSCETFRISNNAENSMTGTLETRKELFSQLETSAKTNVCKNFSKSFRRQSLKKLKGDPLALFNFAQSRKMSILLFESTHFCFTDTYLSTMPSCSAKFELDQLIYFK